MHIDWELVEYLAMALIFLGCLGEVIAEPLFGFNEQSVKRAERRSGIIVVVGLALELLATVRTNQRSDKTIAVLQRDAEVARAESAALQLETAQTQTDAELAKAGAAGANEKIATSNERATKAEAAIAVARRLAATAEAEAAKANEHAEALELKAAQQREKAATAERSLFELQQRTKDRHLSTPQRAALATLLASDPKGKISVTCVGGTSEPCAFASELAELLQAGGWAVDFGETNRGVMYVGSSPSGVLLQAGSSAAPRAAPLLYSLRAAAIAAQGVVVKDVEKDWVGLLVGSKP